MACVVRKRGVTQEEAFAVWTSVFKALTTPFPAEALPETVPTGKLSYPIRSENGCKIEVHIGSRYNMFCVKQLNHEGSKHHAVAHVKVCNFIKCVRQTRLDILFWCL